MNFIKTALAKLGWKLVHLSDPRAKDRYNAQIRHELAAEIDIISPTETPSFAGAKKPGQNPFEWRLD